MRWPLSALLAITLAHSPAAFARGTPSLMDVPLSFWVYVDQTRSDWEIDDDTADTEVRRFGAAFAQHFSDRFHAGLYAGFSSMTQTDYLRTAGLSQSGGHLGLLLRGFPIKTEKFDIDTGGSISYNLVSGSDSDREVETNWTEGLVYAKGILKLDPVRLSLGANYQHISGTEKYNSTLLNQNSSVTAKENVSGMAGIDFVAGGGTIGLHGEWGARNSLYLKFARDF
jgi:hypothetical protein